MENLRVAVMFVCYIYSCSFFIFIRNLRVVAVVEEAEAELSINFDFFYFHGAKMCCTSSNILHINWPEDSIKLIQSNLELWTEFLIVSSYSTPGLHKLWYVLIS